MAEKRGKTWYNKKVQSGLFAVRKEQKYQNSRQNEESDYMHVY